MTCLQIHFVPEELKFSSPADIAKWREDRKKFLVLIDVWYVRIYTFFAVFFFSPRNYPTAENIAKKKQLASERKDRGEVAVTPLHK